MTEPQDRAASPASADGGPDASSPPAPGGLAPGPQAGEDLTRRLVDHVAAYEVDPPAPARAGADEDGDAPAR